MFYLLLVFNKYVKAVKFDKLVKSNGMAFYATISINNKILYRV